MTVDKPTGLNIQVDEIAMQVYDEILQSRSVSCCYDADADADANRLAEKYNGCMEQAMQNQFNDMGMTSVVFVCYTQRDWKLVIDAYVWSLCCSCVPSNRT